MKRLLTLFFAFTVTFLITSCAIIYPNQKYLIGTWKPEKIERVDVPNPKNPATETQEKTKSGEGETYTPTDKPKRSFGGKAPMVKSVQTELRSTLTFNPDKTAIKEFNGKADHIKWKLKTNRTLLLTSSKETEKKTTFDILQINDTSAVVSRSYPSYSMKITYKKEKK